MKRHEALVPLSREHHEGLILARLLQKGAPIYKNLPTDPEGKATYAIHLFESILKEHFTKEEEILSRVKQSHHEIAKLADEITQEHQQLTHYFLSIKTATDIPDAIDILGVALEKHIRKEERVLFPLIEKHCSEAVLNTFLLND